MAGPRDIDRCLDAHRAVGLFLEILGFHRGAVRHLLVDLQEDLLTHDLRGQQAVRQVGQFVLGIQQRAFGQRLGQGVQQVVQAIAVGRADHEGLLEFRDLVQFRGQRQQPLHRDEVGLVQHQPGAALLLGQAGGDRAHRVVGAGLGVDQQQGQVGVRCTGPGGRDHRAVQPAARAEDAGRIDQQDLGLAAAAVGAHQDAEHAEPRGLGLRADDRQLGAGQPVQQGGLPGVRRADDGGEAAAGPAGLRRCGLGRFHFGHAVNCPSRSLAASCSAERLEPAVPLPVRPATVTVTTNTGACDGPAREATR